MFQCVNNTNIYIRAILIQVYSSRQEDIYVHNQDIIKYKLDIRTTKVQYILTIRRSIGHNMMNGTSLEVNYYWS